MNQSLKGTVKWFNGVYGFVTADSNRDFYLNRKYLDGILLEKGDRISFSLRDHEKGPVAVNIQRIST